MPIDTATPWHKDSFDRFLGESLPRLLAERVPLAGYRVEPESSYTCRVTVVIAAGDGEITLVYAGFPQPDAQGVFEIGGGRYLVIPLATTEALDLAEIDCVGEQLYDYIAARLGQAPAHLPWDESLARAWLPLDSWARDFLTPVEGDFGAQISHAQWLDQTNWLAIHTNMRRLVVRAPQRLFTPGQLGRTCPFEVPEGPNMGRIFTIAVGAAIRDRRLIVLDERPAATLGLSASLIPFLEHNDVPRLLMSANMQRQWLPPPDPEPALVQTGNESEPFWCGRNLLTAFIAWDGDSFEDGIVLSESGARRLGYPRALEPGDKLSNRHGAKGVVSRILPDEQMPRLADGTPVELIVSVMSVPSRLNYGQLREAVMGRIARAEGRPAIVPPFHAPANAELRARLVAAGLPSDGMETLTVGPDGAPLERTSTAGWVYWGKLIHVSRDKLRVWADAPGSAQATSGQRQGAAEYAALRQAGAIETIIEHYNTRAAAKPGVDTLAAQLAAGPVKQAAAPSPMFAELTRRLNGAGIHTELHDEQLTLCFAPPNGQSLRLAHAIAHPWLPERSIDTIGALPELPEYAALAEANARLERLIASQAPAALIQQAITSLETHAATLFGALLRPEHMSFAQRTLFSARAVAAPGPELAIDQVGLAEEIAWGLFGPLLQRELGDAEAITARDSRATQALDTLMARSWVIIHRAPTIGPQSFLAFRPLRIPEQVIRMPLLACSMINTDFDGDLLAVFLPVTEAGQREAAEQLTVAAQLTRDPSLLAELRPRMDALLALALLSLTPAGRAEIDQLAGTPVPAPDGFITRWSVVEAMRAAMQRGGATAALALSDRLMRRGFELARMAGVSLGPFVGDEFRAPPTPQSADPAAWEDYMQELRERLAAHTDFTGDFGALVLAVKSGTRSNSHLLAWTIGARGVVDAGEGHQLALRHNYRDGLAPGELFALIPNMRTILHDLLHEFDQRGQQLSEHMLPHGYGALARAMRSPRPGIVFALAAAAGETDTLLDLDSRLFVGLG